jgi:hypothetical protein
VKYSPPPRQCPLRQSGKRGTLLSP